jgi:regulation of enolase protein 1 (concanavalin A-like superfamily)
MATSVSMIDLSVGTLVSMSQFTLPGVPYPVELLGDGGGTAVEPVRIAAGPRTDLFVDPQTGGTTLNAARVVGDPGTGDFQLSVRVEVAFADTFDAGALLVWGDDATWAKLLLEWSPQHQPTVVSVVTRGRSDDANAVTVSAPYIWLRVSRLGGAYAFHYAEDGQNWVFVRHFEIGPTAGHVVGLEVQSPMGDGCDAEFTDLRWTAERLPDLRSGV